MPVATIFPPIPQTVWLVSDPAVRRGLGHPEGAAWHAAASEQGLITQGPRIELGAGLYGVEFQLAPGSVPHDPETQIAVAQIAIQNGAGVIAESMITSGMISQPYGGMYGGARLTLALDHPRQDVELRLYSLGVADFSLLGFKLVPRPGRVWFPADLPHTSEAWRHNMDRSATCNEPTTLAGPTIPLGPGEYRVGIKLMPPPGVEAGDIAIIDVIAGDQIIVPETFVTAEQTLANFGIPDAKMRFRLNEYVRGVDLRVRTLVDSVTVQWVRLATDEEAVWHHYYNMGGSASPMGLPISAFGAAGPSPHGLLGSARTFQHGAIYWTIEHGPCEIYGGVFDRYVEQGQTGGALGYPTSRPRRDAAGQMTQAFEGGALTQPLAPSG
jgi:hypothetical protein